MLPDGQSPSQPQVPGCGCINKDPGANESMGLEQEHWFQSLASGGGDSDGGDWDGSGSSGSSSSRISSGSSSSSSWRISSSLCVPTIIFGTRIFLTSGKMMWSHLGVFNFFTMGCFLQKILTEDNKSGVVTGVNSSSRWVSEHTCSRSRFDHDEWLVHLVPQTYPTPFAYSHWDLPLLQSGCYWEKNYKLSTKENPGFTIEHKKKGSTGSSRMKEYLGKHIRWYVVGQRLHTANCIFLSFLFSPPLHTIHSWIGQVNFSLAATWTSKSVASSSLSG